MLTMDRKELLDILADAIGCSYLSDLTLLEVRPQLRRALCRLEADAYPLREWNDAVEYITRKSAAFPTPEQARAFLLQYTSDIPPRT